MLLNQYSDLGNLSLVAAILLALRWPGRIVFATIAAAFLIPKNKTAQRLEALRILCCPPSVTNAATLSRVVKSAAKRPGKQRDEP